MERMRGSNRAGKVIGDRVPRCSRRLQEPIWARGAGLCAGSQKVGFERQVTPLAISGPQNANISRSTAAPSSKLSQVKLVCCTVLKPPLGSKSHNSRTPSCRLKVFKAFYGVDARVKSGGQSHRRSCPEVVQEVYFCGLGETGWVWRKDTKGVGRAVV